LAWWTSRLYGISLRKLVPVTGLLKVLLAAVAGAAVIATPMWTRVWGVKGVVLAGLCFYLVVAVMFRLLRLEEARILWGRLLNVKLSAPASVP
jgi:hypothetical protein